METSNSNALQPVGDSAVVLPPVALSAPTTIASLPPEILDQIIAFLPPQKRLEVSRVCQLWRSVFLASPICWRGLILGRNANCFSVSPASVHLADYSLQLSSVMEIQFKPALSVILRKPIERQVTEIPYSFWPLVMRGDDGIESQITKVPCAWLGVVLSNATQLKRIDLSAMTVGEDDGAAFRFLSIKSL